MYSFVVLGALAFGLCFFLTPLVRNLTHRLGLLDHPDQRRKRHPQPIPRLGGVAIAVSVTASLWILYALPSWGKEVLGGAIETVIPLLPAAGLVFVVGLLDDLFDLRPWQKLLGQLAAASWVFLAGLQIHAVAGFSFDGSYWLTFPITVAWLLVCTNAFNLIDGIDGLASGVGFFATSTMLVSAMLFGNHDLLALTVPLAAALLAFLRYNFNPASIFLGDSGSLLVGFLLGSYAILWSQKSATMLGMTAPILAVAFPIVETVISILRRFLRGQPIFTADRGHIHHRLMELGLGTRQVAVTIYAIAGVCAGVSVIASAPGMRDRGAILVLFCVVSWIGLQHLGYTEFGVARKILLGGTVQRLVSADIRLRSYGQEMSRAGSLERCWELTADCLRDLGFDHLELELPSFAGAPSLRWQRTLHPERTDLQPHDCWQLTINLFADREGRLTISRRLERGEGYLLIHPIVETVRRVFPEHVERYRQRLPERRRTAAAAVQAAGV